MIGKVIPFILFFLITLILEVLADECSDAVIINDDSRSTAFVPGALDVLLCDSGDQIVSGMYYNIYA